MSFNGIKIGPTVFNFSFGVQMRIYLSRPHMSGQEEVRVAEAFNSSFIAPLGPQLDAFETTVRDYLAAKLRFVALSSGSAALHLALSIAGVAPSDEV